MITLINDQKFIFFVPFRTSMGYFYILAERVDCLNNSMYYKLDYHTQNLVGKISIELCFKKFGNYIGISLI